MERAIWIHLAALNPVIVPLYQVRLTGASAAATGPKCGFDTHQLTEKAAKKKCVGIGSFVEPTGQGQAYV